MTASRSRPPAQSRTAALLPLFGSPGHGMATPPPGSGLSAGSSSGSDFGPHIGIDEAGRGCLAGPVVAAAVVFPPDLPLAEALAGLHDSKQLSEKKRDALAPLIREHALAFGVGFSWQREIDRVNILNATFRAMSRACHALHRRLARQMIAREEGGARPDDARLSSSQHGPQPDDARPGSPERSLQPDGAPGSGIIQASAPLFTALPLLIDGNHTIPPALWQACTPLAMPPQRAVIGGDALVPAISAASILAKTVRDALMLRLHQRYQGYDFARHKGYGTKVHLDALTALGPCRLHRLTFRKVRQDDAAEGQGRLLAL